MFKDLKTKVQERFAELSKHKLFYVQIDRDKIWDLYLAGFTDPIEKQQHNCNCCKSFLRQYGGIVAIVDDKLQTLWDVDAPNGFSNSVKALRKYVLSLPVANKYLGEFEKCGTDKNWDPKHELTWEHFFIKMPKQYVHKNSTSIDTELSESRACKEVLKRGLDEITKDAVDTALELIAQGSLYRGNEFERLVDGFKSLKIEYEKVPANLSDNFCWAASTQIGATMCKIRNTSIGTLLVDLSGGVELDEAVARFEKVVAPTNYKRPTSLVTPKMVEQAKEKINELGLLDALDRRFANTHDINSENFLYIDKTSMLKDVFEEIKGDAQVNPKQFSKVEEIAIDDFISHVLPVTKSLHVLLENNHLNKLVTLITSNNGNTDQLFKWPNPFSWSYTGGITDAIKERVKKAGGRVDAALRASLSWKNADDLDLHIIEPNKNQIYYGDKRSYYTGGELDVDMNAHTLTENPVENIAYPTKNKMLSGLYYVRVRNYNRRVIHDGGFTVQIEFDDTTFDYHFTNNPKQGEFVDVCTVVLNREGAFSIVGTPGASKVQDQTKWNLTTNRFHKVKNIMLSPNYWSGAIGNKHYMFMLEHCASDEPTRPFFNEFLKPELDKHRKFFEVLGGKLKLSPTTVQVAGLGFSDTQRASMLVKVRGKFERVLKINF